MKPAAIGKSSQLMGEGTGAPTAGEERNSREKQKSHLGSDRRPGAVRESDILRVVQGRPSEPGVGLTLQENCSGVALRCLLHKAVHTLRSLPCPRFLEGDQSPTGSLWKMPCSCALLLPRKALILNEMGGLVAERESKTRSTQN